MESQGGDRFFFCAAATFLFFSGELSGTWLMESGGWVTVDARGRPLGRYRVETCDLGKFRGPSAHQVGRLFFLA